MAAMIIAGTLCILFGAIIGLQRIDDYWRARRAPLMKPTPTATTLPFRTSRTQCIACGRDDRPLSIDTEKCDNCHELAR